MTTYPGTDAARGLLAWLTGDDTGPHAPGSARLTLRRSPGEPTPGGPTPGGPPVVQRHVLDWAVAPRRALRPPVPLLPEGTLVLTNSPALVPPGATAHVVGPAGPDPDAVTDLLRRHDIRHVRVLVDGGDPALATAAWSPALRTVLHLHEAMFHAVRGCAGALDHRASVLVAMLDGLMGEVPKPFTGLFGGFVKSLALEYPDTPVVASVHGPGDVRAALEAAAAELGAEQFLPVVLQAGDRRLTLRAVPEPAVEGRPGLPEDALVVAAGGARGIGAAVLLELARRYRPRLVVLGSTSLADWTEQDLAVGPQDRAAFIRELAAGPERIGVREANARFERLQQARTVAANLAELRQRCGPDRVRYVAADLRDPAAARAALDGLDGIDLLLAIAGTNRASDLATKSRADFLAVRDLKVHTYLNLRAALADRPPRRWCNFGSFVGFTGQVGETDYASANDFLTTAAAAGRGEEFTVGWTLWRDTGLGASPVMKAFLAKSNQYSATPTEEGVGHLAAELADARGHRATVFFGARERAAIDAAVPGYLAFCSAAPIHAAPIHAAPIHAEPIHAAPIHAEPIHAEPAPAAPPLPFADSVRRAPGELVLERVFDLDRDGWLAFHQVDGHPTLPGTFVPELAAEAATALVPGRVPVVFEDLRLESFLRVYRADRPQRKRIHARLVSSDDTESVVAVRVLGDLLAPNGTVLATDRLHFGVTVRLRDSPVAAPHWQAWDDHGAEPLTDPYHVDGSPVLLREVFRSTRDTRLHPLGRRAALALDPAAVRRWFPALTVPSVLLDGLVRVAVLDRLEGRWTPVAIPRSVRRIDLYQQHTDAGLAASGEAVELYVTPLDLDLEAARPDNRSLAVRADGAVILQVKDIVGRIVGYLDQDGGRFVGRQDFDRGVR